MSMHRNNAIRLLLFRKCTFACITESTLCGGRNHGCPYTDCFPSQGSQGCSTNTPSNRPWRCYNAQQLGKTNSATQKSHPYYSQSGTYAFSVSEGNADTFYCNRVLLVTQRRDDMIADGKEKTCSTKDRNRLCKFRSWIAQISSNMATFSFFQKFGIAYVNSMELLAR